MEGAMETFILSFIIVSLAVLGMAVGILMGRKPLSTRGCGGPDCAAVGGIGCTRTASLRPIERFETP